MPASAPPIDQGQDDVALLLHAGVARRFLVEAGRAELIAELRLVQDHPDQDGDDDGQRDRDGHILVVREQLGKPEPGKEARLDLTCHLQCVGARGLFYVGKKHVYQIQADPVQHDAGDNLVDVAVCLQETDDAAPEAARHDRQKIRHTNQGSFQASAIRGRRRARLHTARPRRY